VADYDIPKDCLYTREDEWVRVEHDRVTLGITDYAQDKLGDIVFVELPEVESTISQGDPFGVVESVKAVSDLYAPISGEVIEVNAELAEAPEMINASCYSDGWMLVVVPDDAGELEQLMSAEDYLSYLEERDE